MRQAKENEVFRILLAIGIILVVAGHADFHVFDFGGLFPYYSFHVAIFLFVSGYFYNEDDEAHIGKYIKRKALHLLVPYFLWNMFYGFVAFVLRFFGFFIGGDINFHTLFIEPFLGGHQFGYNFAAWFVPALFVIEVTNICMRKVLGVIKLKYEIMVAAIVLLVGMLTVWFAIGGHVWGYYKFPGRILFMLPAFEMGYLYKKKIEEKDTLPNGIYFGILLTIQLCIVLTCAGLAYSTVWCASFANGPIVPYLTTITGIAFWLRISKILSPLFSHMRILRQIGKNTYSIMMHHILAFMLVKDIVFIVSVRTPLCADFNKEAFFTDVNYMYLINGLDASKWIYLAAGLIVPLLIGRVTASYGWKVIGVGKLLLSGGRRKGALNH